VVSDNWWEYDNLPSGHPYDWSPASRGSKVWDQIDFHLDLGCGRVPKGRLGIDHHYGPGVALAYDLDKLTYVPAPADCTPEVEEVAKRGWQLYQRNEHLHSLPFPDESIKSIVSHHCLEHIGAGFERLMEECYRVLEVGGVMRIVVPLFPSYSAVAEYDHKRWFLKGTFLGFCEEPGGQRYTDGFAEPYNACKFKIVDEDYSPPTALELQWTEEDAREMRITLWKHGGQTGLPDPFAMLPGAAK
jgi:SAM-dependent methyltransferase